MTTTPTLSPHLAATLDQLLQLEPQERLELAERLLDSVPFVVDEHTLAVWRRRADDLQSGRVVGVPMNVAMANARKALDEARHPSS